MLLFYISNLYCQKGKDDNFLRFIDSADVYIDYSSTKAQIFLDSIPLPLEKTISGRLSDYYNLKALIHDSNSEYAHLYQCYILALKYAEKEKNYRIAGYASLELFSILHLAKKNTIAYKYLEKAKVYFKLDNYCHGLLEIAQTYEYIQFLDRKYLDCNNLILKRINTYKKVKEDAYFYMFATYMLTSNYIELDDFKNAYKYFNEFKTLESNSTIIKYNYSAFKSSINLQLAQVYFEKKLLDSTSYYVSQSAKLRNFMGGDDEKDYFSLKADIAKQNGNIQESKVYIDSLLLLEKKMFKNIVEAGYHLSTPLIEAETKLKSESVKKYLNGILAVLFFFILFISSTLYSKYYKKNQGKLKEFKDQASNFLYLKSNNEKLTGKVLGLEEYINNLKKDIKEISKINEVSIQREKIKNLYKTLHVNSVTLFDKSVSHLELVNNLNVDFFNQIHLNYPQLNESEVITCYYLFMGFKNKEIAMFLNTSIRALESKRYRIAKKLHINNNETTLSEHLKETFQNTCIELLNYN